MLDLKLAGAPAEILDAIGRLAPGVRASLAQARARVPAKKREVYEYQAAALFALAAQYNRLGAYILEIGTYYGYSAAVLAEAAPLARIVTLNPRDNEFPIARKNLAAYRNVQVLPQHSWDYLASSQICDLKPCDLIFVDGDHARVKQDIPWWERLAPGGLMLFHDYAPAGTPRPCPPVYAALNAWLAELGRETFDVLVVDDQGVGLAGLYR
jgi:predicted O-methyltransferase YrrM